MPDMKNVKLPFRLHLAFNSLVNCLYKIFGRLFSLDLCVKSSCCDKSPSFSCTSDFPRKKTLAKLCYSFYVISFSIIYLVRLMLKSILYITTAHLQVPDLLFVFGDDYLKLNLKFNHTNMTAADWATLLVQCFFCMPRRFVNFHYNFLN